MVDSGKNDLMPHFIYCNSFFLIVGIVGKMQEIILQKMRKYRIQSAVLTTLEMRRDYLITKEKSQEPAEGKRKNGFGEFYEGTINDDLDSFVNNLQNSQKIDYENVWSFFAPKLTKEELKLVEEKNREHMEQAYFFPDADVAVEEMKKSDSTYKYVHTRCERRSLYLSLESE